MTVAYMLFSTSMLFDIAAHPDCARYNKHGEHVFRQLAPPGFSTASARSRSALASSKQFQALRRMVPYQAGSFMPG